MTPAELSTALARLADVTYGPKWRRLTSPEIVDAVEGVLRAWRATQR